MTENIISWIYSILNFIMEVLSWHSGLQAGHGANNLSLQKSSIL
jgi:hypothetical protein